MPFILYVIFPLLFSIKNAFNINTKNAIIYENPLNSLSLFGYSLVLYPPNGIKKAGLFVGAPIGSLTSEPHYKLGVLYKCPILQFCTEITNIPQETSNLSSNVTKFWNGGSIDINSNFDRLVTCASRTVNVLKDNYFLKGACYWFHVNETNQIQEIRPLSDNNKNFYAAEGQKSLHYYSYGQSGFSVHMVPKQHEVVITAPGMLSSMGSVILYKDSNVEKKTNSGTSFIKSNEFKDEIISNPTKDKNNLNKLGLFGYSIASGKFYGNRKLFYVAGSPKSSSYRGEIYIFEFNENYDEKINFIESKKGGQFGEYFGSSLTVGDVNNDGYDDLIVGSPFYMSLTFNEGRVHIFLGGRERFHIPNNIEITISGTATNGQFGTTLQFLGDLNKDGFGDVAIAAPYELDNTGVVYIYEGNEFGLNPKLTQRIVGREIFSEIRGFGISISKTVDIDNNNYLDLAIGAHLSGHVAVLRTSPHVQVLHSLSATEKYIEKDAIYFQIKACFWFHANSEAIINITRYILIDEELQRVQLKDSKKSELITLKNMEKKCQTLKINLKKSVENSNSDRPIQISLRHKFESTSSTNNIVLIRPHKTIGKDNFCVNCLVYDKKRSSKPVLLEIPFFLNCGKDNICTSYLEIEQKISNLLDKYFVLGSLDILNLETVVSNSGEDNAYNTYFLLSKPEFITFKHIPEICEEKNTTTIQCNFKAEIKNGSKETVTLQLDFLNTDTRQVNNSLIFSTTIFTSSQNTNSIKTKTLELKVRREADMKISGKSEQNTYTFGKIIHGKPNFTQILQVEKYGVSPIDLVEIEINIPQTIKYKNNEITFIEIDQYVGDLNGQNLSCQKTDGTFRMENNIIDSKNDTKLNNKETFLITCNSKNIVCSRIICNAGPFSFKSFVATIELKLLADFNFIIDDASNHINNISFTSNAMIRILCPQNFKQTGEEPDFTEISSYFVGNGRTERKIAIWIIIVSALTGLSLLFLIIVGLIKFGFFKRNTKEELEKLKLAGN